MLQSGYRIITALQGALALAVIFACPNVFAQGANPEPKHLQVKEDAPPTAPTQFKRDQELPTGSAGKEGDTIDEFRVNGNRRVEAESVLAQIRSKVGQPIVLSRISDDIGRIYKMGYFADVQVDATRTSDGKVVVTYIVAEKPAIGKILFEGNQELELEDLQDVVNLRPNAVLSMADVKLNAEKVRELYSEKGFFLAEVTEEVRIEPDAPEVADVVFVIREFAKVEVKRVTFLGNQFLNDDDLKAIMATREGDWGSFLTSFGEFKEEAFGQDLQRITAFYYDKGFVKVKVARPVLRLSRDKRYLFITISIEEGPQFSVGEVKVSGDYIVSEAEMMNFVQLEAGQVFSAGTMRQDMEGMRNLHMDSGYAYVNVNPLTSIRESEKLVDITYDVQKGNQVYFGRIEIVGNTKTRDKVIRRELRIEEGQLFSNVRLEASKNRVTRLGFFEKVDITTQRSKRDDTINARVEITERPTGTFQVGAGFSSLESFILNAQVSQNNLFGRGQSLSFQAQISSIRTLFNIQFSEPYFFDTPFSFGFDIYNFDYQFTDFSRTSRGGNITLGYPITDDLRTNVTLKLENVELTPGGRTGRNSQQVGNLFRDGLTSSLRFGLSYDNRNNRLFPTGGSFTTARVEVADDNVTLSQVEFLKYDAESRWYFPLFWQFVLRINGDIGYVQSLDPRKPVPLFERYFAGGPTTVRGFDRFSLGPSRFVARDPNDPGSVGSDYLIGGNKRLILKAEIEFPILTAIGVKGVIFMDTGNAFDDGQPFTLALDWFSDDANDYNDVLRTAVGAGFRWFSPIGPLRFEWGFPIARLRDEKPMVFDFSIGNAF